MRLLLIALALALLPGAASAANISRFASISVNATNFSNEAVVTNGLTLGGVRNTSWPSGASLWTNNASAVYPIDTTKYVWNNNGYSVGANTPTLFGGPNGGGTLVALFDASLGDPDNYYIYLQCSAAGASQANGSTYNVTGNTNSASTYQTLDRNGFGPGWFFTMGFGGQTEFHMLNSTNEDFFHVYSDPTSSQPMLAINSRSHPITSGELVIVTNGVDHAASINWDGSVTAYGGIDSRATNAAVAISATGWTNSFGKNARVWMDGTNLTYTVYDAVASPYYTNAVAVGHDTFTLNTGEKFIVTSGSAIGVAKP